LRDCPSASPPDPQHERSADGGASGASRSVWGETANESPTEHEREREPVGRASFVPSGMARMPVGEIERLRF
jgi:hypothetical protein